MGGVCGTYWGKREMHTGVWWGNLTERFRIGSLRCRWEDDITMDVKSRMGWAWTGLIWRRIGASYGRL
jgi:hypothetical protein